MVIIQGEEWNLELDFPEEINIFPPVSTHAAAPGPVGKGPTSEGTAWCSYDGPRHPSGALLVLLAVVIMIPGDDQGVTILRAVVAVAPPEYLSVSGVDDTPSHIPSPPICEYI